MRQYLRSFSFDGSNKTFQEEDGYVHVKLSLVESIKSHQKGAENLKQNEPEKKNDLELKLLDKQDN
jgi:hypothetical protein